MRNLIAFGESDASATAFPETNLFSEVTLSFDQFQALNGLLEGKAKGGVGRQRPT